MVYLPLWKIWVNGKDDIPYILENKKYLKPPTMGYSKAKSSGGTQSNTAHKHEPNPSKQHTQMIQKTASS